MENYLNRSLESEEREERSHLKEVFQSADTENEETKTVKKQGLSVRNDEKKIIQKKLRQKKKGNKDQEKKVNRH